MSVFLFTDNEQGQWWYESTGNVLTIHVLAAFNRLKCFLQAQAANQKELLQAEESTRKSIQRIQDFVNIFKSAQSPPPPSWDFTIMFHCPSFCTFVKLWYVLQECSVSLYGIGIGALWSGWQDIVWSQQTVVHFTVFNLLKPIDCSVHHQVYNTQTIHSACRVCLCAMYESYSTVRSFSFSLLTIWFLKWKHSVFTVWYELNFLSVMQVKFSLERLNETKWVLNCS